MKRRMQKWVAAIGMVWAWVMTPMLVFADAAPLKPSDYLETDDTLVFVLVLLLALIACVVMFVIFLKMTKRGKEAEGQQADQAEDSLQDKRED